MKSLILSITIASLLVLGTVGKAVENEELVLYLPFDEGTGNTVRKRLHPKLFSKSPENLNLKSW